MEVAMEPIRRHGMQLLLTAIFPLAAAAAPADTSSPPAPLETVTVVASGVSNMDAASMGDVPREQLASQPLLRPAAVLENVPGLIVTQHSGEGKANQYFLRAFNLDHGTDLAAEVDGMPVNMPTHAHGQGYIDLNFLIPELVGDLHYKKGPYYADEGDFATTGAVRMDLVSTVHDSAALSLGEDGFRRALLLGDLAIGNGTLLGAAEIYHNDGPFTNPDDYRRFNGVVRHRQGTDEDYYTLTAMGYSGRWRSTDQVPLHAITGGLIGRYDSLAPTDGGISSRYSLSFSRVRRTEDDQVQLAAYVIRYKLDLYSTFTYFLSDPTLGDQMLQHDDRVVYGLNGSKTWYASAGGVRTTTVIGAQGRVDDIRDVRIDATYQRQPLRTRQDAGVLESTAALYLENSTSWSPWLRTVLGLREDGFRFDVRDKLLNPDGSCNVLSDPGGCNTGIVQAAIFSPKLGIILGPWGGTRIFITAANGYHSNDARGVTRSGENPEVRPVTPLTRASSAELGVATNAGDVWRTTLDVFLLKLKSELVFDGDAGATEPSGSSTRMGVEWSNQLAITEWLHADLNGAYSHARFDHDVDPDDLGCGDAARSHPCATAIAITGRHVPNSPTLVIDAGLSAGRARGWFGSVRARHFGQSPLVEDNSVRSPAYTTVDLRLGYRTDRWQAWVDVFNAADVKWNDIEYYYVSRLAGESAPRADFVVHPGVPRTARVYYQYLF